MADKKDPDKDESFNEDEDLEGDDQKDEGQGDGASDEDDAGQKKSKDNKKEDEDEEPPTRFGKKDNKAWANLRLENKQLREKLKETTGTDDIEDDEETPITRRDLKLVEERITQRQASEELLNEFLTEYPSYRQFEGKIRKYMNDPSYANVSIGFIANGIAGLDVGREEERERKKADDDAGKSKTGGSSNRKIPGKKPDIWSMTRDEFKDYQDKVKQKGRE